MSRQLWSLVRTPEVLANYKTVKEQLGDDEAIFRAMSSVAQRRGFSFDLPIDPTQYRQKHRELERSLEREVIQNRPGLFFDLMNELHSQLMVSDREDVAKRLPTMISLTIRDESVIKLNAEGTWTIQWILSIEHKSGKYEVPIVLEIYRQDQGPIVPWYVVEYVSSGIELFRRGLYASAVALMTVAVEATLKDVLAKRGYEFKQGVSKVDQYKTSSVNLDVAGNSYTLTYPQPMPIDPASLITSASGSLPVTVQIRRVINDRKKGRTDLLMIVPSFLLDNLSSNEVETRGQPKIISGLGGALYIARNEENLIDTYDLPSDLDDVLKAVRNKLLHLSSDSFDEPLPRYNSRRSTGPYTLADFVEDQELVSAFITDIPQFVNAQYLKLCRLGSSSQPE